MLKLFKFDCVSPLELAVCKERLTPEYYGELQKQGMLPKYKHYGWYAWLEPDKKADARIQSDFTEARFVYRLTLEESAEGSIIHCSLNPFSLTGWLVPLCFIFVPLIVSLPAEFTKFLETGTFLPALVLFVAWAAVIGAPYRLFESFARRAMKKLLGALIDAK